MKFLYHVYHRYLNEYSYRVSALSFSTLLAIVPFLLTILSIITLFPISNTIIGVAEDFLYKNFLPESASTIQVYFSTFTKHAAQLSVISILFLILTAFLLIYSIEDTFNDIWRVHKRRKTIYSFLLDLALLFITPFVIGVSVFLVSLLFSLPERMGYKHDVLLIMLASILPIIINTIIFALFFIVIPNVKVRIINGLIGGFIVAIALEITRRIFVYYTIKFSNYSLIYGTFAVIPIFLLWIYIFWLILIFAALITYQLGTKHHT